MVSKVIMRLSLSLEIEEIMMRMITQIRRMKEKTMVVELMIKIKIQIKRRKEEF